MTKYLWLGFLLLLSAGVFAALGVVLVKTRSLHLKSAKRFAQLGALCVALIAYGLMQTARFRLELDEVNTVTLLVVVGVVAFTVVWAAVAAMLNASAHLGQDSDSSIMTRMFADTALHKPDFEATQLFQRKDGK